MITHLLFFIGLLLLVGAAPADFTIPPISWPYLSFLFLCLLTLIFLQNKWIKWKRFLYIASQLEIFLFLFICYFFLNAAAMFPNSQLLSVLLPIILYLGATGFYYFTSYWPFTFSKAYAYAKRQIKVLIPFALPFLIFTFFTDISRYFGVDPFANVWLGILLLFLTALFLSMAFPPLICRLWECKPLVDNELKTRLEAVCVRAHFAHAGLMNWNLFEFSPTAAILGIFPSFRYVLFTPSLQRNLSPEALEAVLAHEIGHSKHRHLLFFPFILFGMVFFTSLALELVIGEASNPAILFVLMAILIAIYFRFVFGFFSRLFERQADLYGMEIGVPVESMIEALDTIGTLTGNSHKIPNWHHFSIDERIQFLKRVEKNPALAARYHRYVKGVQTLFILLLSAAIIGIYFRGE